MTRNRKGYLKNFHMELKIGSKIEKSMFFQAWPFLTPKNSKTVSDTKNQIEEKASQNAA